MPNTRTDLLATAEGLAAAARLELDPDHGSEPREAPSGPERAARFASAAKVALEAARLAENTTAGDIDQALDSMHDLLIEAGVLDKAIELEPSEFLRQAFAGMLAWRAEVVSVQGFTVGYDLLRTHLERLERDFVAGGTDTSTRIAGRIRTTLDDATEIVNRGKQEVAHGGSREG